MPDYSNHDATKHHPFHCRRYGVAAITKYIDAADAEGREISGADMHEAFPLSEQEYRQESDLIDAGVADYLAEVPDAVLRRDTVTGLDLLEAQFAAFA